jgi:hypothetical protein
MYHNSFVILVICYDGPITTTNPLIFYNISWFGLLLSFIQGSCDRTFKLKWKTCQEIQESYNQPLAQTNPYLTLNKCHVRFLALDFFRI